jgi:AbrB family looped-hinge helix DNA binding protein
MEFKTSIDKAGRVLLPKRVLRQMQLGPGDKVQVRSDGDTITVQAIRAEAILKKELGVWVYQGRDMRRLGRMIDRVRKKRLEDLM